MPRWVLYACLAVVSWGAWGVVSKVAADSIPPLLNQILSTLGLWVPALVAWRQAGWNSLFGSRMATKGQRHALFAGLAGGLGNLAFLAALTRGGEASVVVPLAALYPVVTVALASLILRERLRPFQALGIVLAVVAILFLNREGELAMDELRRGAAWLALTITALVLYGTSALLQKLATNFAAAEAAFVGFSLGFVPIALFIITTSSLHLFTTESMRWDVGMRAWTYGLLGGALNGLGVLATLAAYRAGGKASVVTPLAALYPVVTIGLAVVFLGESFDAFKAAGVALALTGGVILSFEPEAESA